MPDIFDQAEQALECHTPAPGSCLCCCVMAIVGRLLRTMLLIFQDSLGLMACIALSHRSYLVGVDETGPSPHTLGRTEEALLPAALHTKRHLHCRSAIQAEMLPKSTKA